MEINKEKNVLITGYNGGPVTAKYDDPKIITQEEANEKLHKILNIFLLNISCEKLLLKRRTYDTILI